MGINPNKFYGKTITKLIKDNDGEETEFSIKALRGNDISLFLEFNQPENKEQQARALLKMVAKVFRDNIPEITDEQIDEIGINVYIQVLEGVMEANGFLDESDKALALMQRNAAAAVQR